MGISYSSCFQNFSSNQTAKLFDAKGNFVRQVKLPLKAAELLLEEEPGHVISRAEEIRRAGRFIAMKAEDEIVARKAYLLVPLTRVNRKVSESDMKLIELATRNKSKTKRSGSKVSPAMAEERKDDEGLVKVLAEKVTEYHHLGPQLKGYIRGWNPVLEPISES
ncbi:hypothetical protein FEM48_Zijuj09G0013700 [Ziziphus jujuba var. spinosa]|uniref:Uncharacterized protein n=1 Tax=Ziziphus jujuba var. spinosa TaxID=714518 RepID=A0A978UQ31_ZIZJJ|nr:hypothetical protein FEM48_Zijuj09G0013700 [Ziziphus jujuba var. spinosa]